MNTGEDESTSGLNGRLRPRKSNSTIPSPVGRSSRKAEPKPTQDTQKRNNTPKTPPNRTDDLTKAPELCPYCDRKFATKLSASKHARRIHLSSVKQDNFIKCLYCSLSEGNPHEVVRHMVDNHPNQYFACLDCHTRFPSTTELAEHKLNVCEKQKVPYRSKLRQKHSHNSTKNKKKLNVEQKDKFSNENKESTKDKTFNGIVISCELKPSQIQDAADIEDNITTNVILPPGKTLANTSLEKNAVIVLDDVHWNKRITPNFTFHSTDADQILSRLGVVHRSPRVGESTRRAWFKMLDENNPKFEKCFDTNFYTRVASNVQENLTRFLDGSFNFNPDAESTIKTRKSKSSVIINTADGFPILLAYEQFSRHVLDGYMPRQLAPRHKWKWDTTENADNALVDPNAIKSDSHVNNCIVSLVSSLDIWTQLCMRRKYEDVFSKTSSEKTEINNIIASELKEILESREIPASSSQVVKYKKAPTVPSEGRPELPSYLGLSPVEPQCELQPAVLSGEWVRPRCFVCCACGAQTRDSRGLTSHMSTQHPLAQVQHYEIVGEPLLNADIFKHLYVPPNQTANRTRPPRGFRDCTKCKKSIALEDIHQHMLDCAGDTPTVRRKCRTRPFGVRRRRPRLPDNTIRKKIRKEIRSRHRQKGHMRPRPKIRTEVGDAETIRKMIADLPAKRVRVSLNSTLNVKTRKVIENKRNKLKIKRQTADGKNIVTRSKKVNVDKLSIETQSEDDDEPLKLTRPTTVKKIHQRLPKSSSVSSKILSKTGNINLNDTEVNLKRHGDRNKNTSNQRDGKHVGESGNKDGGNENNVSHTQEAPLKHSIARITSNEKIQLKSLEIDHESTSVEKNNIDPKTASTDALRQFENETKSDKLDKPPLQDGSKTVDPGGQPKSKLNKPRRRLNDCIAMLMQKTNQAQENQEISNNLSSDRESDKSTTANTQDRERHPTVSSIEKDIVPTSGDSPAVDDNVSQVPNITIGSIKDLNQSLIADNQPQLPNATMFSQLVDTNYMRRLAEASHLEALRQYGMLPHAILSAANVYERRRSHGDPNFAPPRTTRNENSKKRSSRLKSDSRDYQSRPIIDDAQTYSGVISSKYGNYYDVAYANMRRSSYDGTMLVPMNQPLYHPHFLPGAVNTLNIGMINKPMESQHIIHSESETNMNTRLSDVPDVALSTQAAIASQSPARRKQLTSTSSEVTMIPSAYECIEIYPQRKSPVGRGNSSAQMNNNYIVTSDTTPKSSSRHVSMRSHYETHKGVNSLESDIHVQRQTNTQSSEDCSEFESSIDRVSGNYYPSRAIDFSLISPMGYETSTKPEMFYSRVTSKSNDNTLLIDPSTSNFHRKPLYSVEDKLSSEYLRSGFDRRLHNISESEDKNINVMNVASEVVGHPPSEEFEKVVLRESPTRHHVENIINIDRSPQQLTRNPAPTCDMFPLDLRSKHKIMSEVSQIASDAQKKISLDSQSLLQNELCDLSQNNQPRLYVRNISELTGFGPVSIQTVLTNESVRQNVQDDLPLDLIKTSMYNQPSTSGLSGLPTTTDLEVSRSDNSCDKNIISSCILNHNAAPRLTIPTITLSPPDNVGNIKSSGHSMEEINQIDSQDKNITNVETLKSQTPRTDPNEAVNLTHNKTQTTDKRKLVPKEIIAVIEDLPQAQRDRLLDILPQFVRMSDSQSEATDELVNNANQTNTHISTSITSTKSHNAMVNTSASNLTINTNLMPAPSSVIPKKRHSPNVTYSSQLNASRTEVTCSVNSLVTSVYPPPVQEVTSAGTPSCLIGNTEHLTYLEASRVDPYTGATKSVTELSSREANGKDKNCTKPVTDIHVTKRLEVPISSAPIKNPTKARNSNEKTSNLRFVRFNSSKKALSDDKQSNIKDKATQSKDMAQQVKYYEDQNNVQYPVDALCKTIPATNEPSRLDQNNARSNQTLNDTYAPGINDLGKEVNVDKRIEEQNVQVSPPRVNVTSDHFLETENSLTKRDLNERVSSQAICHLVPSSKSELTNTSKTQEVETSKLNEVALQTHNSENIPVNDHVQDKSNELSIEKQSTNPIDVSLNNKITEYLISTKPASDIMEIQNFDTPTKALKETNNEFDSDDEDVSLADIAKLRRPKQTVASLAKRPTVTKLDKQKSMKKNSKQKNSTNNAENIVTLGDSNKKRRTKILANPSCDFVSKDISSVNKIKQQEDVNKSTPQIDEVTETNAIHFQELNLNKNLNVSDVVSKNSHFEREEHANLNPNNNRTEENMNIEKNHQGAEGEVVEDPIFNNTDTSKNENNLPDTNQDIERIEKNINKSSVKVFIDMTTDIESFGGYTITENKTQKLHTNETEKDTGATHKRLLTKKQLIFSKMLCDDETITLTNDKASDTTNEVNITLSLPSTSDNIVIKRKPVKRRKSSQGKRKNKRRMKVLNVQSDCESDSSQSVQGKLNNGKTQNYKKENPNNSIQKSTRPQYNLTDLVDAILVDKETSTSGKRKSDTEDFSTRSKKTKLVETETIEHEYHQSNHQDITKNTSGITETMTVDTQTENVLDVNHKDNTVSDSKKHSDASQKTTCYRRWIDYKPSHPSLCNVKDVAKYDPYDIDLDETIAITEPSVKKSRPAGSSRRSLHTAKSKSPIPIIQSHMSSSDSESSKSDVPLQKYFEEKRILEKQLQSHQYPEKRLQQQPNDHLQQNAEEQLREQSKEQLQKQSGKPLSIPPSQHSEQQLEQQQPNNDQELIEVPNSAVNTLNVSETAATANTLEIFYHIDMNEAEKAKSVFMPAEELDTDSLKKKTEKAENNNEHRADIQSTSSESHDEVIAPTVNQAEEPKEAGNVEILLNIRDNKKFQNNEDFKKSETKKVGKVNNKYLENGEGVNIEESKGNNKSKEFKELAIKESKLLEEPTETEIKDIRENQGCKTSREHKISNECKAGVNNETKDMKEKKRRRSNNIPSVDADNTKTPENTNTDKYLENFGFFPERKPRKSNLLAMKKITETMHMINEGDDMYFSIKDRNTKKSYRETRQSTEGETSVKLTQGTVKATLYIPEERKTSDNIIKSIEKVSGKDSTRITFQKNAHNLENRSAVKLSEESIAVPSKDDSQGSLQIGESTSHEKIPLNIQSLMKDNFNYNDSTNAEIKKSNKNKVPKTRPPGYKEKMYPDIEEFDLFEDKFDKIKRKSRSQAAAAKLTNTVDAIPSTSRASKKTEKKKKKYSKKSYHSSVVPTKGALKGFDGIKISISTQDLHMPLNVSPPRQKKRKRSNSKKKRERKDSDSSSKYESDTNLRDVSVQERDIYEFKDNDDTELLGLRPSTVMDRFRCLNKEKFKHKEKSKDKNNKAKPIDDSDEDDDVDKLKQKPTVDNNGKSKINDDLHLFYRQDIYRFNHESVGSMENPSDSKDASICNNLSKDNGLSKNIPDDDEADRLEEDDYDDDDDNACLVSRSRFVPPTNDDSSFESNGSPESGFVHMSDGIDCNCLPDSKLDKDNEATEPNPEKNAVMEKIFKNNAVRRDANEINPNLSPNLLPPSMDQLFDRLLENDPNNISAEKNVSAKNNKEISPKPGPSSIPTSNDSDIPLQKLPREQLKCQTSHSTRIVKKDKKSRSRDYEDVFTRLLNKDETSTSSHTSPCVTPPKLDEDSVSNNEDLYRQCILSHNEDACSSDSTEHSRTPIIHHAVLVDEYVMMCFKNTQTEDPDTIVEDLTTKIKSSSDDDESDLESESNDVVVLRRNVSTKSHGAQTEDILEEYYSDYEERSPRPGDYAMMSAKSTQTRKHKSKSKHKDDSSDDELFNALEKTKLTLKKFVATTTKCTQTEHKAKSRKSSKHADSSLKGSKPSTSKEKRTKKKKVYKNETKARDDFGEDSSAKEDDGIDSTVNNQFVDGKLGSQSSEYNAGVARQRARRKCTVGKQNVLAEHWSSESEAEASAPRPSVSCTKRGRKKSSAKRRAHVESGGRASRSLGPTNRARNSFNTVYEEEARALAQHGWIVGDSHKKLVTLLANLKRRKRSGHDKRHAASDE